MTLSALLLSLLSSASPLHAETLLERVDPSSSYLDLREIQVMAEHGFNQQVLDFLLDDRPSDAKLALVYSRGVPLGQGDSLAFVQALATARGTDLENLGLRHLTAQDRFVLGLMLALEQPLQLLPLRPGSMGVWGARPLELLSQASSALPQDFSVQLARALVQAQREIETAPCSARLDIDHVIQAFPEESRNLRAESVELLLKDLASLDRACLDVPLSPLYDESASGTAHRDPALQRNLALVGYRGWLIAGTMGGVVVWNQGRAESVQPDETCANLKVAADLLWAGCETRLLRFDGGSFRTYLHDPSEGEPFEVVVLKDGKIVAIRGDRTWRYIARKDAFVEWPERSGNGGLDVLVRQDGSLWRILPGLGVMAGGNLIPIDSPLLGGQAPSRLYESREGQLWLVDENEGFFFWNEEAGRFELARADLRSISGLDPSIALVGADVGVDELRGRDWFLLRDQGLVLLQDGQQPVFFDLSALAPLQDLFIGAGGELWVAGWRGLARVSLSGGAWEASFHKME